MKVKGLGKLVLPLGMVILGLVLMTTVPAQASQFAVCQDPLDCPQDPAGDPNMISNTSSFAMTLVGNGQTSDAPTYVIMAIYNGIGADSLTVSVNGTALSLATPGTYGLLTNSVNNWSGPGTVYSALGLTAGGSMSFGNMNDHNILGPANFYSLRVFTFNSGFNGGDIATLSSNAVTGSYIMGYGCRTNVSTACSSGDTRETVLTQAGLVPEPASLLLLGAGLVGIGIWRRKTAKM